MYIEKIKIGNFGKLSNREFSFSSGVNILEGKNESGKSTLCEFIKFVFYGLSNKSVGGEMSERKRYISWKTNDVSGSVVLNDGAKSYRIERSMLPHGTGYKDEVTVVDLSNGTIMSDITDPGDYFFGVPEEVFVRTVYIRQQEGAYFNGGDIGQAVENIFYSADESINTEKALKKLDDARAMIRHKKNTGRCLMDSLENERDALVEGLDRARRVNEEIMQNEASLRFNVSAVEKNKKDCEKMAAQMRKNELHGIIGKFDESRKYKEQLLYCKKSRAQIREATTFDGFCPDEAYLNEVKNAKSELVLLKNNADALLDVSDLGEEAVYSQEHADYIRECGGKEGVCDNIAYYKNKKKQYTVIGGVFALAALLALIVGMFFSESLGGLGVYFYIGCSVLAICAVVFFMFIGKANGDIGDIYDYFEVDSEEALASTVSRIEEHENYELHRREMLAVRLAQQKSAEDNLKACLKKTCSVLAKWGIFPDEASYEAVISCTDDVLSDLGVIGENIALFDRDIEKNKAVLGVIEKQLVGYDEAAVRAEYDSIECEVSLENTDEIKRRYEFAFKGKEALQERISALESRLAALKAMADNPSELESRLNAVKDRIEELSFKHDAYVLAYEKLQSGAVNLRNRLAPGLSASAGRLMEGLTEGKYKEIGVSDGLDMTYTFEDGGAVFTKTIDCVSSGTKDIAYISLRLALAEMFAKTGKKLPVVFDESFSRLDNGRLKNMLSVANKYAEGDSQVIIMSSHSREADILADNGDIIGVNRLYM